MIFRRSDSKYKEKKNRKPKKGRKANAIGDAPEHYKVSSEFGKIPMLPKTYRHPNGREGVYWVHDPDYQPPLPAGAVRGDVHKQIFCPICHDPKYFYVDIKNKCVQCGREFIFRAKEQKYWYETLHFHFDSHAIRCVSCRRHRRSDVAINAQLDSAVAGAKATPENPLALLGLAETTIQYFERFKQGDLDRAISACRRALKLSPMLFESIYWEAVCHENAKRSGKAADLYRRFVTVAEPVHRCRMLLQQAQKRLRAITDK